MAESDLTRERSRIGSDLRNLLLEGAESPHAVTADAAYFETLRAGVDRYSKG